MIMNNNNLDNRITNDMENWKVELTIGRQILAEVKIHKGIFQEDSLSLLLFVITMMPFRYKLRKGSASYKFIKSQEKKNHLMYMDNIKIFAKNEKKLETLIGTKKATAV